MSKFKTPKFTKKDVITATAVGAAGAAVAAAAIALKQMTAADEVEGDSNPDELAATAADIEDDKDRENLFVPSETVEDEGKVDI